MKVEALACMRCLAALMKFLWAGVVWYAEADLDIIVCVTERLHLDLALNF